MSKKPKDLTKTTEFEVDGLDEAYAPAHESGKKWKPAETEALEVERPPELRETIDHSAKIWILERRARGWIAQLKRWAVGKRKGG